jgi:H+/gluconate symporter-like permease
VPVISALAAMHGMVPPHPGPLTAIATLKTTVGPTMLYGFLAAIPAMVLGGPLYGAFIAPRMSTKPDQACWTSSPSPQSHRPAAPASPWACWRPCCPPF